MDRCPQLSLWQLAMYLMAIKKRAQAGVKSIKEVPNTTVMNKNFQDDIAAGHQEFIKCVRGVLRTRLLQKTSCKIPAFKEFLDANADVGLPECRQEAEAKKALKVFEDEYSDFSMNFSRYNCPMPCERNSYTTTLTNFHNNSILFSSVLNFSRTDYYLFTVYYQTLMIEKRVETLVYDVGGLLSAAGGNLGLCLGLSCMSILFTLTHCTKAIFLMLKRKFCYEA